MIPPHILKIISEVSDFAGLYKAHYKAGAVFGYELRGANIDIEKFYKDWCKRTKRNGGVLVGKSIMELLNDFDNYYKTLNNDNKTD